MWPSNGGLGTPQPQHLIVFKKGRKTRVHVAKKTTTTMTTEKKKKKKKNRS
jgi:hypothetical protein